MTGIIEELGKNCICDQTLNKLVNPPKTNLEQRKVVLLALGLWNHESKLQKDYKVPFNIHDGIDSTIADNGLGMTESVKQKVFDHLFTTKSVGKGTGLRLAIAKSIVESTHSGKLSFHSVRGEGKEFFIEIPL